MTGTCRRAIGTDANEPTRRAQGWGTEQSSVALAAEMITAATGMSMDDMVRDMRNRFLVALVLTAGITLWSPMGRDMFGFTAPTPSVFAMTCSP